MAPACCLNTPLQELDTKELHSCLIQGRFWLCKNNWTARNCAFPGPFGLALYPPRAALQSKPGHAPPGRPRPLPDAPLIGRAAAGGRAQLGSLRQ